MSHCSSSSWFLHQTIFIFIFIISIVLKDEQDVQRQLHHLVEKCLRRLVLAASSSVKYTGIKLVIQMLNAKSKAKVPGTNCFIMLVKQKH
ncbi:hypothetical protein F2P81_024642 [Scophthalmus maximus]|uniref:Uncharacterized protein n=1 Tax=Scophthalmus maximus TaxID=52904 RepID=A0A6A4RY12_SCOMX|nr:hypothetical protein F2P81_024642 [Scophthalmus maximus]